MTSDDTINAYIRTAVETIVDDSSYKVIKADQNAPRPKYPYCTVKVLDSVAMSYEEFSKEDYGDTQVQYTSKASRNIMVSFNFFKGSSDEHDSFYIAGLVRQALNRRTICSALGKNGLGLCN